VTVLGGAKVSDKIAVIRNLLPKVSALLVGGGMAYTFLRASGVPVGKSLVEEDRIPMAGAILEEANKRGIPVLLPSDHVAAEDIHQRPFTVERILPSYRGLDIGPKTIARYRQEIEKARMVLWNGPMGLFEVEPFRCGTVAIARSLAEIHGITVVAGGDTVAAARLANVEDKITHLSTGGGATLEFLEGKLLPGIEALQGDV
jgi:phosphoglycerate kinase